MTYIPPFLRKKEKPKLSSPTDYVPPFVRRARDIVTPIRPTDFNLKEPERAKTMIPKKTLPKVEPQPNQVKTDIKSVKNPFKSKINKEVGSIGQNILSGANRSIAGTASFADKFDSYNPNRMAIDALLNKILRPVGIKASDAIFGKNNTLSNVIETQKQYSETGQSDTKLNPLLKDFSELTSSPARKLSDTMTSEGNRNAVQTGNPNLDMVNSYVSQPIGGMLPSILTGQAITSGLPKSVATQLTRTLPMGISKAGNKMDELAKKGYDDFTQIALGAAVGANESLTELIPFHEIIKPLNLAGKTLVKKGASIVGDLIKNALAEGIQEAAVSPLDTAAENIALGQNNKLFDLEQAKKDFGGGVAIGTIMRIIMSSIGLGGRISTNITSGQQITSQDIVQANQEVKQSTGQDILSETQDNANLNQNTPTQANIPNQTEQAHIKPLMDAQPIRNAVDPLLKTDNQVKPTDQLREPAEMVKPLLSNDVQQPLVSQEASQDLVNGSKLQGANPPTQTNTQPTQQTALKQPTMTPQVDTKQNEVFYTDGKVEVIKNPTDKQYEQIVSEFNKEYPHLVRMGEPKTRRTFDIQGNEYVWKSTDSMHSDVERFIDKKNSTITHQNKDFDLKYDDSIIEKFTKSKQELIQTSTTYDIDSMNTPEVIEKALADAEKIRVEQPEMYLKMNLQFFAEKAKEKLTKLRKTMTNSIMNSDIVPESDKKILEANMNQIAIYEPVSDEKQLAKAKKVIGDNPQKAHNEILSKDTTNDIDLDIAKAEALIADAFRTGRKQDGYDLIMKTVELGTRFGREVQAISMFKKMGRDGMLYDSQSKINNIKETMKKDKKKKAKIDKAKEESNNINKEIDEVDKKAFDTISTEIVRKKVPGKKKTIKPNELTPAEILASRIETAIKPKTAREKSLIDEMVNELFGIASKTLPKTITKPNPLLDITLATKNRQLYAETWGKAKEIVKKDLEGNAEAYKILDDYFSKGIKPVFSKEKLNTIINSAMGELNLDMGEIVANIYKDGRRSREQIKDYLINQSGLKDSDADYFSSFIEKRLKELTKAKKETILKKYFPGVKEKALSKLATKKIQEITNAGAFVNMNYIDKVMDKMTPLVKKALSEAEVSLDNLVKISVGRQSDVYEKFALETLVDTDVNPKYYDDILDATDKAFKQLSEEKRTSILNNLFKERTVIERKTMAERVYELINLGAFDKSDVSALVEEKYGIPNLSIQNKNFIVDTMDDIENANMDGLKQRVIDNGLSNKAIKDMTIERLSDINIGLIMKQLSQRTVVTGAQKISTYQAISHLLNLKTIGRNIYGNTSMLALEQITKLPSLAFDRAIGISTGNKTTSLPKFARPYQNARKRSKETGQNIKLGIDLDRGKYELFRGKTFDKGVLSVAEVGLTKGLKQPDEAFKGFVEAQSLYEMIKSSGNDKADGMTYEELKKAAEPWMLDQAKYEAEYTTFQDDTLPAKMLVGVKDIFNNIGVGTRHRGASGISTKQFGIGDFLIKYTRVPGNLIARSVEYTPLGYIKAIALTADSINLKDAQTQRNAALFLGRATTGTGLAIMATMLALKGIFIDEDKESDNDLLNIERNEGLGSFKLNLSALGRLVKGEDTKAQKGDKIFSYGWNQPLGSMLAIGSTVKKEIEKKGNNPVSAVLSVMGETVNQILDLPTLSIIQSMFYEGMKSDATPFDIATVPLTQGLSGFVPGPIRQTAQLIDPIKRETRGENQLQTGLNRLKKSTPFLSKTLEPNIGSYGKETKYDVSFFNTFINPAIASTYNPNELTAPLKKIAKATGENSVFPQANPPNYVTVDGEKVYLTPKQKTDYQKEFGRIIVEEYTKSLKGRNINTMTESELKALANQLINRRNRARDKASKFIQTKALD